MAKRILVADGNPLIMEVSLWLQTTMRKRMTLPCRPRKERWSRAPKS